MRPASHQITGKEIAAYKLAKQVSKRSLSDKTNTSSLLKQCLTIAKLLGREKQHEWIRLELNGYDEKLPKIKDLEGNLPPYRWVVRMFYDIQRRPIVISDDKLSSLLQRYPLVRPISELEKFTAGEGLFILADKAAKMINALFNAPAIQSLVPAARVAAVIEAVRTRMYDFADDVIIEFEYGRHEEKQLVKDLQKATETLSQEFTDLILPRDIVKKGNEMAEVYHYLYVVENSLRLFVETASKRELDGDYFKKLQISTGIRNRIDGRKSDEAKKKWLRLRGDSALFYIDFRDLGLIITNNWKIFEPYFPDLNWITTKIKELADCRDRIAHNSYVEPAEKDTMRVYFTNILKQLSDTLSPQKGSRKLAAT